MRFTLAHHTIIITSKYSPVVVVVAVIALCLHFSYRLRKKPIFRHSFFQLSGIVWIRCVWIQSTQYILHVFFLNFNFHIRFLATVTSTTTDTVNINNSKNHKWNRDREDKQPNLKLRWNRIAFTHANKTMMILFVTMEFSNFFLSFVRLVCASTYILLSLLFRCLVKSFSRSSFSQ